MNYQDAKIKDNEMHQFLPAWDGERFKIVHNEISAEDLRKSVWSAFMSGGGNAAAAYQVNRPGTVTVLYDKEKREVVMSDTRWELNTNLEYIKNAHGHVIVGGLGIGFTLLNIQDKPEVTKITVIELHPEIIEYVSKTLPLNSKVEIINADILTYEPPKGQKYDCIYFDIWNSVSWENHPDMKALHTKWKFRKNPGAWMGSWCKDRVYQMHYA